MVIEVTPQLITTAFAVLTALIGIVVLFAKAVRWFDRQKKQDAELRGLENKHDVDMKAVQKELSIIIQAQLACLKGLQEQGCNGPVTKAVDMLETYLNETAHEQ